MYKMFINSITPETLKFIKRINTENLPLGSYLGEGTAIALQIGHRKSIDLDFFSPSEFNENQWLQKFESELNFKLIQKDWQTLVGDIGSIKFSLFYYKYGLIGDKDSFYGIKLASLPDLAAMKLDTVISRGAKRDLIDIYFLSLKYGFAKMFEFYDQKYGNFEERELMIKKALTYFEEADKDENPDMLVPFKWEALKAHFLNEIKP